MNESGSIVSTGILAQTRTVKAIYILYLLGLVTGPVVPLICAIFALINHDAEPAWLRSHFELQIRTFWIGLLFALISALTVYLHRGIFWVLLLLTLIWFTVRCIKGLIAVFDGRPYDNPETWLW
ncbi:MAG TPA: hypothetical protein VGS13_07390 [Stellaceae bacterium]|nr:hypothetical protein [Stellaceae bacterium]